MNAITIHLQVTELENVRRHAEALGVESEDIARAALLRLMRELPRHPQEIDREILHFRAERAQLPMWSQSSRSHYPFADVENDYTVPGL